ncbi:MAG: T9SS type A sorting domain-containing protein [Fluviicola sp.]|nr:T9SS type A sorting domain-containing protein [Fluviicola sp.]
MKQLFITGMLFLGCINQTTAQVWKHDINFENVNPNSGDSHTLKGVVDENDHTYLLKELTTTQGVFLYLNEYLPDGTNGFQISLGTVNPIYTNGHNSLGIAIDQNYIYVATEFHPTNVAAPHNTKVIAYPRTNPTFGINLMEMTGNFSVTDMALHNNKLYVYGNTAHNLDFLIPQTNLAIINSGQKVSVLMELDVSNVSANQSSTLNWITKVTYNSNVESGNIAVADNGLIYLSGTAENNARIGNGTGGVYHQINFPTAQAAGFVARFLSNGSPDPSFIPININNFQNNQNSTQHRDNIEDFKLDPQTNHLYLVVRNLIRKYSLSTVGTPPMIWQQILPGLTTNSNRLAISHCNEMYVTGIRVETFGPADYLHYYTQSLNKQSGAITTTMVSNDGAYGGNSQGEVILIQSDGDKVVAGDYKITSNSSHATGPFYVDYESMSAAPANYPSITYNELAYVGSFIGIYEDGVKGELTNDFVLTNSNNVEMYNFPCWQSIILNGSASTNETNHFIDLWKQNGATYQWYGTFGWLGGEAGTDNISQLAQAAGIQLTPGNYQIKLAVQNNCVGWLEKVVNFTITTETLNPLFNMNIIQSGGTTYSVACTSLANPPHAQHMWYVYNLTTNTIVPGSMVIWTAGASSYNYSGLSKQNAYRVIHVVRDPKGCAVQVNYYIQISMMRQASSGTIDEQTLEVELQEIESQLNTLSHNTIAPLSIDDITVFPNPTEGSFTLDYHYDQDAEVTLHSATGQAFLAHSITSNSRLSFDLTPYASGVYFMTIRTIDGHQLTQRVIKR